MPVANALKLCGQLRNHRTGPCFHLAPIREADRLECEAWNAIMWAGGPAMPSPGDPQAEPTIGKAINGGFDLLEAKCNRCDRVSLVPLRALRQPPETPVWKLEAVRSTAIRAAPAGTTAAGSGPTSLA